MRSHPAAAARACVLAAAAGLLFATMSCGVHVKVHITRATASVSIQGTPPLPKATALRLPTGVFYILTGPNPLSCNVWRVDNSGREVEMTHNRYNYGISWLGASEPGVVLADAATGVDELARLTAKGPVPLPDNHGEDPVINSSGQIAYLRPPYKNHYFELEVKKSFGAPATIVYRQKAGFGGAVWGPGGSIAVMSAEPKAWPGPMTRILVVNSRGKTRDIATGFSTISNIVWGTHAELAVTSSQGVGEVITANDARHRLPGHWVPAAWNEAGTNLLVEGTGKQGSLGLWSPSHPARVTTIGDLSDGALTTPLIWWLTKPAKL